MKKKRLEEEGGGSEVELQDMGDVVVVVDVDTGEVCACEQQQQQTPTTTKKADVVEAPPPPPYTPAFKPDSAYSAVDALRTIAVVAMVVKNAVQRLTVGSNPVARALGADWVAPLFVFAAGCRCGAEQHHLDAALASKTRRRARQLKAEAAAKQYVKLAMIFAYACVYLVAVFGPLRLCPWDILHTIALTIAVLFPLHRTLPAWALLCAVLPILALSPPLFGAVGGADHYENGFYITDWRPASLAGSLFVFGPTPFFPYVAFGLLGDVLTQWLLTSKTVTYARRSFAGFMGLIALMVGMELCLVGERRGPFTSGVLSYVFPAFAMVPLTLSWSLVLAGAYTATLALLSTILDPISTAAQSGKPSFLDTPQAGHRMLALKRFLARTSKFTMSIYICHVGILVLSLRMAGLALESSADAYVNPPGTVWHHAEWLGTLVFVPAGVLYFILHYTLFWVWDVHGRGGLGTMEWSMGWAAQHTWTLLVWLLPNRLAPDRLSRDRSRSRFPSIFIRP